MKFTQVFFVVCSLIFACVAALNDRPIVGVLTQDCSFNKGKQYIAAGYVKWLEAGGARVVPIKYDTDKLDETLNSINGLLLPGGGASFTGKYWDTLLRIFEYGVNSFDAGNPFPIWGTCLGFEELVCAAAKNASFLDGGFDSEDLPLPLELKEAAGMSRFFADMPETMMKELQLINVTYNNHVMGITPEKFASNKILSKFFDVLSTNKDRKGKPFVSTIEGHVYPFWGTQWHPEKISFEWDKKLLIPHTSEAVSINMYPVTFFVDQCRRNKNKYASSSAEENALIYNYKAESTYKKTSFEQCYFF